MGRSAALRRAPKETGKTGALRVLALAFGNERAYFTALKIFAQVLDSADELGVEEQESLVEVLQRRLAECRRDALLEAVKLA